MRAWLADALALMCIFLGLAVFTVIFWALG